MNYCGFKPNFVRKRDFDNASITTNCNGVKEEANVTVAERYHC